MSWDSGVASGTREGRVLIFSRAVRARTDLSLVAALLLTACAKPTEVELRLRPCGDPVKVDLDIQGYDGEGAAMTPLSASFEISDEGVFGDGYATVGLKKPDGMVTADFTLTWHGSDELEEVVTLTDVAVPAAGEVLTLEAKDCAQVGDSTTGEPTSGGSTSTGSEPGTSTGSTSTGDETTTTTTGTTEATTTGDDTTTTTGTTEVTTESTGGSSTGDTILGDPCEMSDQDLLYCEDGGAGLVGDVFVCDQGEWKDGVSACSPAVWCSEVGFMMPFTVGCSGVDEDLACVCREMGSDVECTPADQGCEGNIITLCQDTQDGPRITKGTCPVMCNMDDPMNPYCK